MEGEVEQVRFGTSRDVYWRTPSEGKAQFLRVRERDGIRQITVKGRDRPEAGNTDRLEVDIDSTSETFRIHRLVSAALGKPAGVIEKTYHVLELESEWDTVCVYEVTCPVQGGTYIEVEAKTAERMLELEQKVVKGLSQRGVCAIRAPGSLFEMMIDAPRGK